MVYIVTQNEKFCEVFSSMTAAKGAISITHEALGQVQFNEQSPTLVTATAPNGDIYIIKGCEPMSHADHL